MATMKAPTKLTQMSATAKHAQIRLTRRSPAYWRVTIDNPPINVMGPEMVKQFQEVINVLEADEQVRVVVFDSAVDDYFLNHSDFTAKIEDLTSLPEGTTGLPPWPDFLARLTRFHAGLRHELCQPGEDRYLAMGGGCGDGCRRRSNGPASRTHRPKPRPRVALELGRHQSRPGRGLRLHQSRLARRRSRRVRRGARDAIAKFDKWAIAQTKRLVNTSLPPDVELGAGWDACIASLGRPAAQNGIKALMECGFHKPGDVENRLGYYLGQIAR